MPAARLLRRDSAGNTSQLTREEVARHPDLRELAAKERSLPVINTQLISTTTAFLIALTTFAFFTLYKTPGRGFALMMMLEGTTRFLIEGMRTEPKEDGALTLSMLIGLGVAAGGIALWIASGYLNRSRRAENYPGYPEVVATTAA
jgi:prolipoprotein diacylglyceryltransferase